MKINKKMIVAEIIRKYPITIEVLSKQGLQCIGCMLSSMETLEEGAEAHGMNEKQIDKLVEALNKAISKKD